MDVRTDNEYRDYAEGTASTSSSRAAASGNESRDHAEGTASTSASCAAASGNESGDHAEDSARITAILLAGGKGTRMGGSVRKQFMELAGKPVLMWPLEALVKSEVVTDIVLVVPNGTPDEIKEYKEFIRHEFLIPLQETLGTKAGKVRAIVPGGKERYNSVYNGLEAIHWDCRYVFIHDGARPMLTEEMLRQLAAATAEYHAVVAASPSKDTVKITDDKGFVASTPDRAHVWNIQTPQCFDYMLVLDAYRKVVGGQESTDNLPEGQAPADKLLTGQASTDILPTGQARAADLFSGQAAGTNLSTGRAEATDQAIAPRPKITDDAMVVEYATSAKVRPIDTGYRNIKITTPEDILIAEAFLKSGNTK